MEKLEKFVVDASTPENLKKTLSELNEFLLRWDFKVEWIKVSQLGFLFFVVIQYDTSIMTSVHKQLHVAKTLEEAEKFKPEAYMSFTKVVEPYFHRNTPNGEVLEFYFVWAMINR